jgi:ferredoxin
MTDSRTTNSALEIAVDVTECCASGMCASVAPTAFGIDSAGYAVVLPTASSTDIDTVVRAARNCPTLCISVTNGGVEVDLFG